MNNKTIFVSNAHPDDEISLLIKEDLTKDTVMAIEDAFETGAKQAFNASSDVDAGHLANVIGQNRHFFMNEMFYKALASSGIDVSPINGNRIIIGTSGKLNLIRMNITQGDWQKARKGVLRKEIAKINAEVEKLVQPDFFSSEVNITGMTVFFIAYFNGSRTEADMLPTAIEIAVPDKNCKALLFRENITVFQERYNVVIEEQEDKAYPKLKQGIAKKGTQ